MSGKYIITEEEINQILLHSPYALSTNPARDGLSGEQVKRYFYDFIPVLAEKLNSKMVDVENEMNEHKSSEDSHGDIRGAVDGAMEKATQAYDLATGKSKVHIYPDYKFLFYDLNSEKAKENLNIQKGDIILVAQKNAPDFIVYSIDGSVPSNSEGTNISTIEVRDENVATVEPSPSKAYYFNKSRIAIIGIESGIDTSVFATKDELEAVESIAKGANQAVSFGSYKVMVEELNNASPNDYNIGQNFYIIAPNVPDLWIYQKAGVSKPFTYTDDETIVNSLKKDGMITVGYFRLAPLETQKVDLTEYVKNTVEEGQYRVLGYDTAGKAKIYNVSANTALTVDGALAQYKSSLLGVDKPSGFLITNTPINPYHAANKKYVDDLVANIETSGTGGYTGVTIADTTLEEDSASIIITKDTFADIENVKDLLITFEIAMPTESNTVNNPLYVKFNGTTAAVIGKQVSGWAHDKFVLTGTLVSLNIGTSRMCIAPTALGANNTIHYALGTVRNLLPASLNSIEIVPANSSELLIPAGSKIKIEGRVIK